MQEIIKKARTHRWFNAQKVVTNDIIDVIDAARFSSQARNQQKIRFVIVNDDQAKVNEIFNLTNLPTNHKVDVKEQPVGYIVFAHDASQVANKELHGFNCGVYYQNLNLLLAERGIRGVLIYSVNREKVRTLLSLGDNMEVDCVYGYGYPKKQVEAIDTTNEAEQSVILGDVHQVSKLTKEKLVIKTF